MRKLGLGNVVLAAACAALIAACGGGNTVGSGGSSSGGASSGGTSSGGTAPDPVLRLGVLSGSTFAPGVISIGTSPLAAGGSSGLRVDIVDTANNNTPVTGLVTVTFSSTCISAGTAVVTSPVTTTAGSATSTYRAQGCSGNDLITATADVGGSTLTATGTINVVSSPISAISFVSTTPTAIRLRGAGQPSSAVVIFEVRNEAGGPVANQDVTFSLDTSVGGITLNPAQGKTDTSGRVQTTVNSGTVATSVRVTANTGVTGILPAQSESLVISTGLADQDSFSLSVGCPNIEGAILDGTQTSVTVRSSDRFNNPVPDGTAISFRTEGGTIAPQCLTSNGVCSVQFTSQNPRTADHRVSVLATAIGEESFTDVNGDGRYDAGEAFEDLGEAFIDANESGGRNAGEVFIDFNSSGAFNAPSGDFTGVLCDSGCGAASSLNVRGQHVIVMSGSTAVITATPNTIELGSGGAQVLVSVGDDAGQPMPGTTTIQASTSFGSIIGSTSYTQACTNRPGAVGYGFFLTPPETATSQTSGLFTVTVTSPSGVVTTRTFQINSDGGTTPPPPGNLGAIQFVSALPTNIGIQGTGLPDTSTVQFRVVSDTGVAVVGQQVSFELSTTVGGISFTAVNGGVSDEDGVVSAIVKSGTVHTSVRLKATAVSGSRTVSALSEQLTISTGLPDQNSVSLSLSDLNPQAFSVDGTEVTATIRAADRFNNPVPDGTAFAFTTSGGSIGGNCATVDGACAVTWRSQNPRVPRAAILAFAIGEESFTDLNGDGRYDDGEPFQSLAEPWRDDDLDGAYDAASEEFQDFNGDGLRTDPNTVGASGFESVKKFTGSLCDGPGNCDVARSLYVYDTAVLTMSDSRSLIDLCPPTSDVTLEGGSFTNPTCTRDENGTPTVTIFTSNTGNGGGATATVHVVVRDANDQPLPSGTTITLVNDGGDITITPTEAFVVPQTTDASAEGNTYTWSLTDEAFIVGDQFGALTLTVTVPDGTVSRYQLKLVLDDVTVTADAGPNQTVTTGSAVTLDGTGSASASNAITTYAWTQTGGTTVTLSSAAAPQPTFTAPATAGTLTFQLKATDSAGSTGIDTVQITVN